jgi:hypothetical protein
MSINEQEELYRRHCNRFGPNLILKLCLETHRRSPISSLLAVQKTRMETPTGELTPRLGRIVARVATQVGADTKYFTSIVAKAGALSLRSVPLFFPEAERFIRAGVEGCGLSTVGFELNRSTFIADVMKEDMFEEQRGHLLQYRSGGFGKEWVHLDEANQTLRDTFSHGPVKYVRMAETARLPDVLREIWGKVDDEIALLYLAAGHLDPLPTTRCTTLTSYVLPLRLSAQLPATRRKGSNLRDGSALPDPNVQRAEKNFLAESIEQVLALVDDTRAHSGRIRAFKGSNLSVEEQRQLLTTLFCHRATVGETIRTHVRNLQRCRN